MEVTFLALRKSPLQKDLVGCGVGIFYSVRFFAWCSAWALKGCWGILWGRSKDTLRDALQNFLGSLRKERDASSEHRRPERGKHIMSESTSKESIFTRKAQMFGCV